MDDCDVYFKVEPCALVGWTLSQILTSLNKKKNCIYLVQQHDINAKKFISGELEANLVYKTGLEHNSGT